MPTLKLHLDDEEMAPVRRLANQLKITPEDIRYSALNRMMMDRENEEVRTDIAYTRTWRAGTLPPWSDTARSVHAYEGQPDQHADLPE